MSRKLYPTNAHRQAAYRARRRHADTWARLWIADLAENAIAAGANADTFQSQPEYCEAVRLQVQQLRSVPIVT